MQPHAHLRPRVDLVAGSERARPGLHTQAGRCVHRCTIVPKDIQLQGIIHIHTAGHTCMHLGIQCRQILFMHVQMHTSSHPDG